MKWLIKFSVILLVALSLLLLVDRFLFSFGKMQLFGLWMMQEHASGLLITPQQVVANNANKFAPDIANMLETAKPSSLTSKVALAFAEQVKTDPTVQAQLMIIARQHPHQKVRCYWQTQLEQGYQVTMINNPGKNQQVSSYLLVFDSECPATPIEK